MSIPTRLNKKENLDEKIRCFIARYYGIIFIIGIIFAFILFLAVCFAFVPPTESGSYYNHLGDIA